MEKLLYEIINSKRLLSDHVELLENCNLDDKYFTPIKHQKFTFLRALGLTLIAVVPINVTNKWYNTFKNQIAFFFF